MLLFSSSIIEEKALAVGAPKGVAGEEQEEERKEEDEEEDESDTNYY